MTTHPGAIPTPRPTEHATDHTACAFTLVYPIARTVLNARAPAGPSPIIELCVQINQHGVQLRLTDPNGESHTLETQEVAVTFTHATDGWLHLDAPGIISCSIIGFDTPTPQLVYAKTTILGQLGLKGGRFHPPTLRPAALK